MSKLIAPNTQKHKTVIVNYHHTIISEKFAKDRLQNLVNMKIEMLSTALEVNFLERLRNIGF